MRPVLYSAVCLSLASKNSVENEAPEANDFSGNLSVGALSKSVAESKDSEVNLHAAADSIA